MKRVLFSMVLLLVASFTFAQEKNVKEAKSIANGVNPDFAKAEELINQALTNPETKDNAETWDVAGLIQRKRSEKEMENAYLRKPYDTLQVYNSALNMCKFYFKCDELAQIPNEKGKIKNKYRKSNSATILAERGNLINGGIQFFNLASQKEGDAANEDNKKALDFFATYIDIAINPMFEKENLLQTDTVLPQIAYYASLAAAKMEDYPSILKYAPYAQDDKEVGKYAMEFISTALKAEGDTVKWIASLKEGIQKYPEHSFFFGHLIDYYSNNNKYDEAMQFADDMLAKDPNNTFYLYVKGYLYHNMKDYDKAIEFYKKTIEVDPNYAEAYSNLGLIYCLQAQDFSEKATTDINDPKYKEDQATLKTFYEKAKPYYEKARELKPDQKDLWLNGLYRVYYNLQMGPEFEEIEVLKSDTVEIKKFIRKMNLEFIGFYCNHKRNDQECDLVFKKVADIYESKEYSALVSFIENLSHCVWQIRHYDNINKKWNDDQLLPLAKDIKNLVNDLTKLAGNISKYNASMNPDCSRCKAEVRKYNYVLKEVKRMREENEEVKRMREEIDNNKEVRTPQTIKEFIVERFNGIDRFKLSEVKESYKKLFNITKTYAELKEEIENIGGYKVTNCQRILYVSKL